MRASYDNIERLEKKYGSAVTSGIFAFCTSDAIDADIRLDGQNYLYIARDGDKLVLELREVL
jgi:hypothetical protein